MTLSAQSPAAQSPRFIPLSLLAVLLACQLPLAAECLAPTCQDGWLPVGPTDCVLIGDTSINISQARNYCLSLGNNSKLIFLRNHQFNQLLFSVLNNASNATAAPPAEPVSYWTGATVTNRLGLDWLDAGYTDLSMSQLPGGTAVLLRYAGLHGALRLGENSLQLTFLNGFKASSVALCARQPIESPYQPAVPFDLQLRCDGAGATLHRGVCYRVLNSPSILTNRWNKSAAIEACHSWTSNASLGVINDFNTQFLATALIGSEAHGHAWIGLEYTDAKYWTWRVSNGTADIRHSDWKTSEPSKPFERESCAVAHQREASLGEWNNVPCTHTFASALCQAPPSKSSTSQTPSPIGVRQDADGPLCRSGFYAYGDVCWLLDAQANGTRATMADQCTGLNATLALFHHRGEQAFLSALAEQLDVNLTTGPAVWLGLNVESDKKTSGWLLTWDDGSSADYDFVFDILPTQIKNSENVGQLCTSLNLKSNGLEARLCNDTQPLMACRYNLIEHPFSPNKSQDLRCPDSDEPAVNGKCFKPFFDSQLTWTEANNSCQKLGGNLASVHTRHEQVQITKMIKRLSANDEAWLGLKLASAEGQQHLMWSDSTGAQFFQFRHGYPKPPIGMSMNEMCVSVHGKYGEWVTDACSKRLPYICQIPGLPLTTSTSTTTTGSTTMSPTPTPAIVAGNTTATSSSSSATLPTGTTSAASSGGDSRVCKATESDQISLLMPDGSGCMDYLFVGSKAAESWLEADRLCKQRLDNKGQLASISSLNESQTIYDFLLQFNTEKVWLGASTSLSPVANAYSVWSDGSPMRFANFVPLDNPPDQSVQLAKSLCVAMETKSDSKYPGQFRSLDCGTKLPFLCKRSRLFPDSPVPTSAPEPAAALHLTNTCANKFVAASPDDAACYRLLPEAVDFSHANEACKDFGAQLASYQTQRQLQCMASLLEDGEQAQPAWIGLKFNANKNGGVFEWTDNSRVRTMDWAAYAYTENNSTAIGSNKFYSGLILLASTE